MISIVLAGDSIVQSYPISEHPQTGWGQVLALHFTDEERKAYREKNPDPERAQGAVYQREYPSASRFSQAMTYEIGILDRQSGAADVKVRIDNRAMAGRSLKTYLKEERRDDMLSAVEEGTYVLMQYGHNDANEGKPERYLTPEEYYAMYREEYCEKIRAKGGIPVIVTPATMLGFDEEKRCKISFPAYREMGIKLSQDMGYPLIDLGKLSAEYCTGLGQEGSTKVFLQNTKGIAGGSLNETCDDAHLQFTGAVVFAGLVYQELKKICKEGGR